MGNYATNAELIARYADAAEAAHATDSDSITVPDDVVLTEIVGESEGWINSYIRVRYATPVSVADLAASPSMAALLKGLTLDEGIYRLCVRGDLASEIKKDLRTERIEWLQMVASGKVELPATVYPTSAPIHGPTPRWGSGDSDPETSSRVFTKLSQAGL